jgi:hypothetical protein
MTPVAVAHRRRPWRVHDLAPDFELLDLWRLPVHVDEARGQTFEDFHRVFLRLGVSLRARPVYPLVPRSAADCLHLVRLAGLAGLVGLRLVLGRVFRLDAEPDRARSHEPPEWSVATRLTDDDRTRDRGQTPAGAKDTFGFRPVYVFEHEALHEVANRTVHALLHLSLVPDGPEAGAVLLAVYVKSRGPITRFYLALIRPFRFAIVYPALLEHIGRTWRQVTTPPR